MNEDSRTHGTTDDSLGDADWALQSRLLAGVSRTFALTIPELPGDVRRAVGNGYLLCRIADTIEDDPQLDYAAKTRFHEHFLAVLAGTGDARSFSRELSTRLCERTPHAERELIHSTATVVDLTNRLPHEQRIALLRCVDTMCHGMPYFQRRKTLDGLGSIDELNQYCYVVAGVVGEMLTELFCLHSPPISRHREKMMNLAICFGQGLQMTNILKDVWEDRHDGSCWLPRTVFHRTGRDLGRIIRSGSTAELTVGIPELVGIAHAHLRAALTYTCLIPRSEVGIRRFCLWAIGLAVLTLQNIHRRPGYEGGGDVKVSRHRLRAVILGTNSVIYSNTLLRALFELAARGLPLENVKDSCDPETLRSTLPAGIHTEIGSWH